MESKADCHDAFSTAMANDQFDEEIEETDPLSGFWLEGDSLAPPCQADLDVITAILDLSAASMKLGGNDVLYDLGCGDGRICLAAASKFGCKAKGVEIEEMLIQRFHSGIKQAKLEHLVTAIHGDLRTVDFSDATVVVIYLLPESIELIKSNLLQALDRGCTIICNTWGIKDYDGPVERITCGQHHNVTLIKYVKKT